MLLLHSRQNKKRVSNLASRLSESLSLLAFHVEFKGNRCYLIMSVSLSLNANFKHLFHSDVCGLLLT